jgi:LCP family protein required for cell wall assembly
VASAPDFQAPPTTRKALREARRKSKGRSRRLLLGLVVFLALCLVVAGGALGYVTYRYHQIHKVTVHSLTSDSASPAGAENILLVGDNTRCGLKKYSSFYASEKAHVGSCSEVGGGRSDVVMILHLDPATHSADLVSLPRDLWLPMPGGHGLELRVDDALNSSESPYLHLPFGPSLLVQTIEQDLGVPINHYVELNFYTFEQVVNTLGGVNLYFPTELKDAYSGLRITSTGCQHLNGAQALALVRARHLYYMDHGVWHYDGTGDLGRIKRSHIFLRVLAAEVAHRGISNPLTANAVLGSVLPDLTVDRGFSLGEMVNLALAFHSVNPETVPASTLPVIVWSQPYHDLSNPSNYQSPGDVVFPFQPNDQGILAELTAGMGTTAWQGISPSSVTVSVLNGSGSAGTGASTASALSALGFKVVGTGQATYGGDPSETVVRYAPGYVAQGEKVLSEIAGEAIMAEGGTVDGSEVTVVTGSDFAVAAPASSSSTTSASQASSGASSSGSPLGSASTTTSTAPASSPSSSSAPSSGAAGALASSSKLSSLASSDLWNANHSSSQFWWDPRACPAGSPG